MYQFTTLNRLQAAATASVIATGLLTPAGVGHSSRPAATVRASITVGGVTTPRHDERIVLRAIRASRSHSRTPIHRHSVIHKSRPVHEVRVHHLKVSHTIGTGVWDRIAQCESGGNWHDTAGYYEGGLQFAPVTWRDYGGYQFASHAYYATREQQIIVAIRVRDGWHGQGPQGWNAWPVCSRKAGAQ